MSGPADETAREDGARVIGEVELLSWGPDANGAGYVVSVEGLVYQHDDAGVLRRIDGADLHPGRPFWMVPDEAAHEQGDEPAELGPEWVELGYTGGDYTQQLDGPDLVDDRPAGPPIRVLGYEHTEEGVIVHAEVGGVPTFGFDGVSPASGPSADNADYDKSQGQERDAGWLSRRIAEHRPVPPPVLGAFRIGGELGGVPEDAPELERFVANRADKRRLARRGRRRG